jgi:tetratricopeptide (TPR) repeat protein
VKQAGLKERDLGQFESDMVACRDQVLLRLDEYQHGVALRNLAKVLHWSGKFTLAADRASDALELLGSDPESRFILADCLKNTGELQRARIQYELLMQDHPDYGRAYLPLGQLLLAVGEADAGLEFLLDAVAFDPESAYAYAELGKYYLQQREWKLAGEALLEATRLNPEDRQSQLMLDMCRQALGIAGYPTMQ